MKKTVPPLSVIDAESLSDKVLPAQEDVVEKLLPPGLTILGGAPKVGKSWLTLDLCNRIANGEEFLGNPVRRGSTLYLCLEDTERRLQNRINTITDDPSSVNFLSLEALSLGDGLCDQVRTFAKTRPDLVLVVIDTLQLIRGSDADPSYANDYQDIRLLKALADELGIAIVAVHHLRKQKDDDPLNTLSGTTGLSGAADAVLILQKVRRGSDIAKLICTGRDIEYRELTLQLNKHCVWEVEEDSKEESALLLPEELRSLVAYMKTIREYCGGNTEFTDQFCLASGVQITAKALKQQMNLHRQQLEHESVQFRSHRSNGQRLLDIWVESDASDAGNDAPDFCVPCVPADATAEAKAC